MNTLNSKSAQVPSFDVHEFSPKNSSFAVVVPVINEGARISSLIKRFGDNGISEHADIIIVDGGSTDGSLGHGFLRDANIRTLLVKTGSGKLSAQLRCAYSYCVDENYEGIITMDGNDKDDPKDIFAFIDALKNGYDFAQASRFIAGGVAENTPLIRDLAIRMIHAPALSAASGFRWTDTTQGFRAYSRRMMIDPQIAPFRDVFMNYELLAYLSYRAPKLGYRCIEIPTVRRYPKGKVPTKISGFRGNVELLEVLWKACTGRYDP